jgi:endonuclease G
MADGDAERKDNFHADSKVDGSADPADYARTGYDRGHLEPAADMQWSERAMDDSFLMSNIAPQKPKLNRGIWKRLESKTRDWARAYKEVWITTGPVLTSKFPKLKRTGVSIPEKLFKVILDSRSAQPKAIAFVIPQEFKSKELCDYAISVDEAERVVGLDFFPALDDDTENEVEARTDWGEWMRVGV